MAEIKTVGVIGAGQMGGGIAHVCALAGYEVLLNDIDMDRVVGSPQGDRTQPRPAGRARRGQRGR